MKAVIVLSFSILFLLSNIFSQPTGLIEAKGLGLIDFSIHGNTSSTHYYRPLDLHMINRSGECLQITVGRGLIMEADEEAYQNFITTREEQIVMEAYEQKSVQLFAMCIEKSDMSPVSSTTFNPTHMADSALAGLVTMIEKDSLYTYESQAAIWALACNTPLTEIVGFDTVLTRNLVEYVAAATGQEVPPPSAYDNYERNYYCTSYKVKMGGEFQYDLYETRSITIAMFDKDNIVVRELYKNQEVLPGPHHLKFNFDATAFEDEYYFVKVIDNGEIVINMKIDMPERSRDG